MDALRGGLQCLSNNYGNVSTRDPEHPPTPPVQRQGNKDLAPALLSALHEAINEDPVLNELLGGRSLWRAAAGLLMQQHSNRLPATPLRVTLQEACDLLAVLRRTINVLRENEHLPEVPAPDIDPYFWHDRFFQVHAVLDYASVRDPEVAKFFPDPHVPGLPPPEYRPNLVRGLERFMEVIRDRTGITEPLEDVCLPPLPPEE